MTAKTLKGFLHDGYSLMHIAILEMADDEHDERVWDLNARLREVYIDLLNLEEERGSE